MQIASVSPLHVSASFPLGGFPWNFFFGTSMITCLETQKIPKIWPKSREFTCWNYYVLLLQEIWILYETIVAQHSKMAYCWVTCNSTKHRKNCCVSTATIFNPQHAIKFHYYIIEHSLYKVTYVWITQRRTYVDTNYTHLLS